MPLLTLDNALPELPDGHFYDTAAWYRVFAETCLDPGDLPRIEKLDGGHVLPMRERPDAFGPLRGRQLEWLGNYYTCRYAPLLTNPDAASAIAAWGREVRRRKPRPSRLVFAAMDRPSAGFDALWTGLRRAGYLVEATEDFGNWYLEPTGDFTSYWASRNSRLRNTVERKERALFRTHRASVEILESPAADGPRHRPVPARPRRIVERPRTLPELHSNPDRHRLGCRSHPRRRPDGR